MNYFSNCINPDEIRAIYRQLAKQHHPDLGGDTKTMQEINAAYERALKQMDGQQFDRTDSQGGIKWTYQYSEEMEREIINAIDAILSLVGDAPDITVTIVGLWLWVVGNTYPIRQQLRDLGCYWNAKRNAWNWKPQGSRSRYNQKKTLDEILSEGQRITRNHREKIA